PAFSLSKATAAVATVAAADTAAAPSGGVVDSLPSLWSSPPRKVTSLLRAGGPPLPPVAVHPPFPPTRLCHRHSRGLVVAMSPAAGCSPSSSPPLPPLPPPSRVGGSEFGGDGTPTSSLAFGSSPSSSPTATTSAAPSGTKLRAAFVIFEDSC
ncbi:unnamed protein product, partial [Ectocarpus sp. 12 AP-2014]